MDTKAFFPASRWPLLVLFSAFCVMSGCQRKIPEPGEPIIEQHDEKAATGDRTENQDNDPGADR